MNVYFLLGEKRKIWLEVTSRDDEVFTIRNASFELTRHGEIIDNGDCVIDGHTVMATIQPPERGKFNLIYSFEIGGEIIKEKVVVNVE